MDTNAVMTLLVATRLYENGALEEAEEHCRQALLTSPGDRNGQMLLAAIQRDGNKLEAARDTLRKVLKNDPENPALLAAMGKVSRDLGAHEEAEAYFRHAVDLEPDSADIHLQLGRSAKQRHAYTGAEAHFRQAMESDPNLISARRRLGAVLEDTGRLEDAIAVYREGLEAHPKDASLRSGLLHATGLLSGVTPEDIFAQRGAFGNMMAATTPGEPAGLASADRDPSRPLKIGYVSGDFCKGPVGFFFASVLANHDRLRFETICYDNGAQNDDLTWRLKENAHRWRDVRNLQDDAVARMIRGDGVDILIDLSGFRERGRLSLFARRLAPVQASWIGSEGSTGLKTVDVFLADSRGVEAQDERFFTEKVTRLPHGRLCYAPPSYAPPVGPPPSWAKGYITFGCFSDLSRINGHVMALWGRLLNETPKSRLLIRNAALTDEAVRGALATRFAAHGLPPVKLDLLPALPHADMMECYNQIDVALDPFPASDPLKTCEALWMGAPVITLPGATFASRHAAACLDSVGLSDLIAKDEEAYVAIPNAAIRQPGALATMRRKLRERMSSSPLCNGETFTRNFEMALRTLWRDYCLADTPEED